MSVLSGERVLRKYLPVLEEAASCCARLVFAFRNRFSTESLFVKYRDTQRLMYYRG